MNTTELKGKTVAELREEAKTLGITGISSMKKDALVDAIGSHSGGQSSSASGGAKSTDATQPTDKAGIKKRIRELKAEKAQAVSERDTKRARGCTKEIHDHKRMLRKLLREAG